MQTQQVKPDLPSWPHWWPVLFGPAVVVMVYVARWADKLEWFGRDVQDDSPLPYVLTLTAFAIAAYRAVVLRNVLMALVAAMALAIFNREVHWFIDLGGEKPFSPTSTMAYATLAAVLLLGRYYYDRVGPFLARGRVAQWLIMAAISYVFAVAVGKGWIKSMLPDDKLLRSYLEESAENAAHIMLIIATCKGWRKGPATPQDASSPHGTA